MFNKCKHQWETVVNKELPSAIELLGGFKTGGGVSMPMWVFEKRSIVILKCILCGKLDKTESKTHD